MAANDSPPTSTGPGRLVIISGPSGAGKSTVVRGVLDECPLPLVLSISATTRQPRPGEIDGTDYHFLSKDEFQRRQAAGDFLEAKEVHGRGDWYGTLRQPVADGLAAGKWMVLEIDVEGMLAVRPHFPEAITIFIHVGSTDELERRLRVRGTETEVVLQRRLMTAKAELAQMHEYKYQILNLNRDHAVREIVELLVGLGAVIK